MADAFLKGGRRALLDTTTGQVVSVDPSVADSYLQAGDATGKTYAPLSQEELDDRIMRAKADTLGGQATALGQGVAEGLYNTVQAAARLGVGTNGQAAMAGLTAEQMDAQMQQQEQARQAVIQNNALSLASGEAAQARALDAGKTQTEAAIERQRAIDAKSYEQQVLEETNPLTSTAGTIIGESLPWLLAPIGPGAAGGAARLLGGSETALGRFAAGKVGKYAIEGAIEGGLQNATSAVADPDSDAQDILASFGMGAALGGGMGATFGLGSKAAEALGGKFGRLARAEKELADIEKTVQPDAKLANFDAARKLDETINQAALDLQPKLTEAASLIRDVKNVVIDATEKRDAIKGLMGDIVDDPTRIASAKKITSDAWADMSSEFFEPINGNSRISGAAKTKVKTFGREIDNLYNELEGAANLADAHSIADRFKRTSQKEISSLQQWMRQAQQQGKLDSLEVSLVENQIAKAKSIQERVRSSLEDPLIYGEQAASAQKSVNAIFTDGGISSRKAFHKQFFRDTGETSWDTGYRQYEMDAGKMSTLLRSLGRAEGDTAERAMTDYLAKEGPLLDEIAKHYSLDDATRAKLVSAKATLEDVQNSFSAVRTAKEQADAYAREAEREAIMSPLASTGMPMAGAVIGSVVGGGPVGAAVGSALGAVAQVALRPTAVTKLRAAIREAAGNFSENYTQRFGQWVAGGAGKVDPAIASLKKVLAPNATKRRMVTRAAVAAFLGDHESMPDAMETRKRQAAELDPMQVADDLYHRGVPIQTALAAGNTVATGKEFLQSVTPSYRRPGGLRPGVVIPPTALEQQRYVDAWSAISNPESVVADVMSGTASPVQVEALRAVYPKVHANLVRTATKALESADMNGIRIPLHKADSIAMLLGLPESGSFSDQLSDSISNSMANSSQQPAPNAAPSQPVRTSPSQEFFA